MTSKKLLLAGLIAALGLAGTSQAAVVTVRPTLAGVLNGDFTPADPTAYAANPTGGVDFLSPSGAKYILQVDFLLTIDGLNPPTQAGYGNAAVNVAWNGLGLNQDLPGWNADTLTVDHNGTLPGAKVPKWAGNADSGADASDLQNILIEQNPKGFFAANIPVDPRSSIGVAPYVNPTTDALGNDITPYDNGDYVGTVFFEIDAVAGGGGSVHAIVTGASTYDLPDLNLSTAGNEGATSAALAFNVVPEPSSLALLGLGGALLAIARKRR